MKQENKTIYRCDFCRKYYIRKHHAQYHEKWCKFNPNNMHKCFDYCKHLQRDHEDETGITYFSCEFYPDEDLYSYIAERIGHDVVTTGTRMPLTCKHYKQM